MKDIVLSDIKNLFENEEEEHYDKPTSVNNFGSNNYIEYKNKSDTHRILSVEEYLNKIRPCLREIINDLKQFDTEKLNQR